MEIQSYVHHNNATHFHDYHIIIHEVSQEAVCVHVLHTNSSFSSLLLLPIATYVFTVSHYFNQNVTFHNMDNFS